MSSVEAVLEQNAALLDGHVEVEQKCGGWKKIKDIDEYVEEMGRFAVMEHKQRSCENLDFVCVESGEIQVVAGKKYRLIVKATDHKIKMFLFYQAIVLDIPWERTWKLLSFVPLNN